MVQVASTQPALYPPQLIHFGGKQKTSGGARSEAPSAYKINKTLKAAEKTYGFSMKDVVVQNTTGTPILEPEKKELIYQAVKAHELAKTSKSLGNHTHVNPTTAIKLKNGLWSLGTTIEGGRDLAHCGERSAITIAFNDAVQRPGTTWADLKVDSMVLTFHDQLSHQGTPCGDCQTWMASGTFFSPDTKFVDFYKDVNNNTQWTLRVRPFDKIQPLWGKQQVSKVNTPVTHNFPIIYSGHAAGLIKNDRSLTPTFLQELITDAQRYYQRPSKADKSGENVACSVAIQKPNGRFVTAQASRGDHSKRWHGSPDLFAEDKAWDKIIDNLLPTEHETFRKTYQLKAMAYYGDDKRLMPEMASLGRFSQLPGGLDKLILVIEDNTLHVRTIADYMGPSTVYISKNT